MAKLIFEGILTLIPDRDAYTTQPIYGIVTGVELFSIRNNPNEFKKLILKKLKLAYEEGVNRVETAVLKQGEANGETED